MRSTICAPDMHLNFRTTAPALLAAALLAATSLFASPSSIEASPLYDDPTCRGYADDGDHQRAAECYYGRGEQKGGSFGTGENRYAEALEFMQFAEEEALIAGDLFLAADALQWQANLTGFRLKRPAEGTVLGERSALLFLQVDPDEQFSDDGRMVRLFRLRQQVAFSYNQAGQFAEDIGDLERAYDMFIKAGRATAEAYLPAEEAAAELITTNSRGDRLEIGNLAQFTVFFNYALRVADDMEDPALFVDTLIERLDLSLGFLSVGLEKVEYGFKTSTENNLISNSVSADFSQFLKLQDNIDDAFDYAISGAPGATEPGQVKILSNVSMAYAMLAAAAERSHEDFTLAASLYERAGEARSATYGKENVRPDELRSAAFYYNAAANAAKKSGDLQRAEDLWVTAAVTYGTYLDDAEIDRMTITISSSKLDATYYRLAGTAAQDRGDCDTADSWFEKEAQVLSLYDGQSHEPRECRPPSNIPQFPNVPSNAQPTATTKPADPDAALDDLINTFGRMTREVAEERIKVEMKDNLGDLAAWLGEQMEVYLNDTVNFLDEVYDSLPEFAWEEQEAAGDIPSEVEEQPDDPGGPGLSFSDLIDAMTKKVPIPSNLDSESGEELYDLVTAMLWSEDPDTGRFTRTRASGGEVIELAKADGTKIKTGVFVTPDGRVLYSTDGTNFYPTLTDAIDPSYGTRGVEMYQAATGYLWQRGFEGRSLNREEQLINDVSRDVLDEFRREMSSSSASSAPESVYGELKDPFKDVKGIGGGDPYTALEGKATKSAHDYIEGKLWDPVKDKLKAKRNEWMWAAAEKALDNSIEFETRQNFKFLLKEYQDLGTDAATAWEDIKKKAGLDLFELTGVGKTAAASGEFMVSAIKQMGKGLQDSDFGVRSRSYIKLRQQGQTPKSLWQQTRSGEIPELEFSTGRVTRSGIESTMAQQGIPPEVHIGLSFSLYEQAYQRFLLAQQLGRNS